MANDIISQMHGIMQSAFDRANQRQAAMAGLNASLNPIPAANPTPAQTAATTKSPDVNPIYSSYPDHGGGNPNLVTTPAPTSYPDHGGGNPNLVQMPQQSSLQGFSGRSGGGQGYPPVYQPPVMGASAPPINGIMVPGTNPLGGVPSPGLGGAVGQTQRPMDGGFHTGDINPPGQSGQLPTPGMPGSSVPIPPGGFPGQGTTPAAAPSGTPAPGSLPAMPSSSGPPAIPNPRTGMPTYPAASGPSQRRPMPVPPWVYQSQQVQVPANILAGNPNLAQFAPGGVVDTSGAMGPIWGPINKGQLPGGLAGQMFQGTIDPRTGKPLGAPGGPAGQPAGGVGINASLVPGVGGPVPSPGLGGVPGGISPAPPSSVQPGIGGVPPVAVPNIPNVGGPTNALPGQPVVPGAGNQPAAGGVGAAPPGGVPAGAAPSALPPGVRSARDILASRLPNTNAVPGSAPPPSQNPAAPVPPGGAPPAAPAPAQPGTTSGGIWDPQGAIQGAPQNNGGSWDAINQYDPSIAKWTQAMGRPDLAPVIKGIIAVETGGQNIQGGEPGSTGLMQIMPAYWSDTAQKLGVDLNTPDGQIAVATAILAGQSGHGDQGSWQANFQTYYFPHDDSNGTTQAGYTQFLQSMYDQGSSGGGGAPAGPLPKTQVPGTTNPTTGGPQTGTVSPTNAPTNPSTTGTADPTGNAIIADAKKYLGRPYVWGQWDCSMYTYTVAQDMGYKDFPVGSHPQMSWAQQHGTFIDANNPSRPMQPGDVAFFQTGALGHDCTPNGDNGCMDNVAQHVAIYVGKDAQGNDIFLNALNENVGTVQSTLQEIGGTLLGWTAM